MWKTATVSEPPFVAKSSVCDGLVMISWSESKGPRLNEGVIPRPPVENGEPVERRQAAVGVPLVGEDRVAVRVVALDVDDAARPVAGLGGGRQPARGQEDQGDGGLPIIAGGGGHGPGRTPAVRSGLGRTSRSVLVGCSRPSGTARHQGLRQ